MPAPLINEREGGTDRESQREDGGGREGGREGETER
jgi:hypothetical protein